MYIGIPLYLTNLYRISIVPKKIVARAKRGRVVQNEYEKANRRHGPTRHGVPRVGQWFRRKLVKSRPTSYLKPEHFRRKIAKLRPTSYLKRKHFRRKMAKLKPTSYLKRKHFRRKLVKSRPTSYFKREHFRRKLAKLRPAPYLKREHFRRKLAKLRPISYLRNDEIEAHFLLLPRHSKAPAEEAERFARAQWRIFVFWVWKTRHIVFIYLILT